MRYGTLTVTTTNGITTVLVGNDSSIEISHPHGAANELVGGTFTGFAEKAAPSGALVLPSSRVKTLAYSGGNVTVTEAGGAGGSDTWTKATDVPVQTTGLNHWYQGTDGWEDDASVLTVRNAVAAVDSAGRYVKKLSLLGLSAISLTEAA